MRGREPSRQTESYLTPVPGELSQVPATLTHQPRHSLRKEGGLPKGNKGSPQQLNLQAWRSCIRVPDSNCSKHIFIGTHTGPGKDKLVKFENVQHGGKQPAAASFLSEKEKIREKGEERRGCDLSWLLSPSLSASERPHSHTAPLFPAFSAMPRGSAECWATHSLARISCPCTSLGGIRDLLLLTDKDLALPPMIVHRSPANPVPPDILHTEQPGSEVSQGPVCTQEGLRRVTQSWMASGRLAAESRGHWGTTRKRVPPFLPPPLPRPPSPSCPPCRKQLPSTQTLS